MSARANDIGALLDTYRDAVANRRTAYAEKRDADIRPAKEAEHAARSAVDAALASVCEDAERRYVDPRPYTGCAHSITEACPKCVCPTCNTPAVETKELGWIPASAFAAALTPVGKRLIAEQRAHLDAARLASPAPSTRSEE